MAQVQEHFLFFQRTGVQLPALASGLPEPSITPASKDPRTGLLAPAHIHACTHTHVLNTNTYNENKTTRKL